MSKDMKMQLIFEALNKTDKVFNELRRELKKSSGDFDTLSRKSESSGKKISRDMDNSARKTSTFGRSVTNVTVLVVALWMAVNRGFNILDRVAFKFSSTLETANLAIASSLISSGQYVDQTTGKALQGMNALNEARRESKNILAELQVENFKTIATLDQLVRAFQETLPVAMSRGFDVNQAKEYSVAMVQAAGAIGLSLDQMAEETRSLLMGTINPRTSRIGVALGLTNADIRQNSQNAQQLFDFLMSRLAAYKIAGIESQKTWAGVWSNTKDIGLQLGAKAFEPLFESTKQHLLEISDHLIKINEQTNQIEWNPAVVDDVESFQDALETTITLGVKTSTVLLENIDLIFAMGKAYIGLKVSTMAYNATASVGSILARMTAMVAERNEIINSARAEVVRLQAMRATEAARFRAGAHATALAAAEKRLTATLAEQAVAVRTLKWSLATLGGPIGIIITLLGTAATAWWIFGDEADKARKKSKDSSSQVLSDLQEQVRALKERNRIAGAKMPAAEATDAERERLRFLKEENELLEKRLKPAVSHSALTGKSSITTPGKAEQAELERRIKVNKQEINALITLRKQLADNTKYVPNARDKDDKQKKAAAAFKKFQQNNTLAQAGELQKRLLAVDKWLAEQKKLLEKAGMDEQEIHDRMTEAAVIAGQKKARINRDHAKAIREEEIQTSLAALKLAEQQHTVDKGTALQERIRLQKELLTIQTDHLLQLDKLKDPTAWYAQADAIGETRGQLIELNEELRQQVGTHEGGVREGLQDYVKNIDTAFEQGKKLSEETARAMESNFSDFFFDAMTGKLKSFSDYLTSFFSSVARAMSDIMGEQVARAILGSVLMPGMVPSPVASSSSLVNPIIAHTGGKVGSSLFPTRTAPAAMFTLAPRFHKGMGLAPDEFPAILQNGEVVLSRQQVQGATAAQEGNVTYAPVYQIDARGADAGVDQRIRAAMMQASEAGYAKVLNDIDRGGPISKRLRR